jgi:hypothetical protein
VHTESKIPKQPKAVAVQRGDGAMRAKRASGEEKHENNFMCTI